jgi:hypothetical protein
MGGGEGTGVGAEPTADVALILNRTRRQVKGRFGHARSASVPHTLPKEDEAASNPPISDGRRFDTAYRTLFSPSLPDNRGTVGDRQEA